MAVVFRSEAVTSEQRIMQLEVKTTLNRYK